LSEDLFRYIEQQTGFQVTTGLYLLIAFVFVVSYVGLATGGSWLWLRKRKLVQHAWGTFALIAVVAAGFSLAAVHLIRGVGFRVQELAFVDAEAGARDAAATVYFGLMTPTHTTLDVCVTTRGRPADEMPDGVALLRPMPVNTGPLSMGT